MSGTRATGENLKYAEMLTASLNHLLCMAIYDACFRLLPHKPNNQNVSIVCGSVCIECG